MRRAVVACAFWSLVGFSARSMLASAVIAFVVMHRCDPAHIHYAHNGLFGDKCVPQITVVLF